MFSLKEFLVEKCPQRAYYIPNFINEEEEKALMKNIYDSPKPKWTQLKNRRLQNWGGIPQLKGMIVEKIPEWLDSYCEKIAALGVFEANKPNHILINEYQPGQGITVF
jgi:alkylated DNA repair protein alkB homolog 6